VKYFWCTLLVYKFHKQMVGLVLMVCEEKQRRYVTSIRVILGRKSTTTTTTCIREVKLSYLSLRVTSCNELFKARPSLLVGWQFNYLIQFLVFWAVIRCSGVG